MSERSDTMVMKTEVNDDFSRNDSCDFLSLMCDSITGQQICEDRRFSTGSSVIEDDDLYEELHDTANSAFADSGIDILRDKLDSIDLV